MKDFNKIYQNIELVISEDAGIKPKEKNKFYGSVFNSKNYKIYVLKSENDFLYVGKTNQGIGTKFGQGFTSYVKDANNNRQGGYGGYKWIKKYINTNKKLTLFVYDTGNNEENEFAEAIEAELVLILRNKYRKWPKYQNEIHFNNNYPNAVHIAMKIFNIVVKL